MRTDTNGRLRLNEMMGAMSLFVRNILLCVRAHHLSLSYQKSKALTPLVESRVIPLSGLKEELILKESTLVLLEPVLVGLR